jgi:hypothetical protein
MRNQILFLSILVALNTTLRAQDHSMHDMAHDMDMSHDMGHDMSPTTDHATGHPMGGMLSDYSMTQESSGTAWQPRSTPMGGMHLMADDWMLMLHGNADLVYDHAGGDRGGDKVISTNMFMVMAMHPLGEGTLGLRSMLSLEPTTIGKTGYPELLQTGETANGETPLIDRQHPHDLFMELAGTYSFPVREDHDHVFVYLGLPGEPALGPATFMHRFSGMDNPEAPITHHWLDSTHITFGVATVGYIINNQIKIEGSAFTGREPDENRWDIESPKMDSQSARITWNPTDDWSFQTSYGHLNSPEQLEPNVDQNRFTASATYNKRFGTNNWQTLFAFGQDQNNPGNTLDAFLLESAVNFDRTHTVFARFERVAKDELFAAPDPLAGKIFWVTKISLGYIYDFPPVHHVQFGMGALGSIHFLPDSLDDSYGDTPTSFMVFARAKL